MRVRRSVFSVCAVSSLLLTGCIGESTAPLSPPSEVTASLEDLTVQLLRDPAANEAAANTHITYTAVVSGAEGGAMYTWEWRPCYNDSCTGGPEDQEYCMFEGFCQPTEWQTGTETSSNTWEFDMPENYAIIWTRVKVREVGCPYREITSQTRFVRGPMWGVWPS